MRFSVPSCFSSFSLSLFFWLAPIVCVCCQTPDALNPNAQNGSISVVAVQPDGKILIGGLFNTLGGQARSAIGRLNPDGALDTTFNPGASGATPTSVGPFALQTDGKILVGGRFTTLAGQPRNNIGRLYADGTPDMSFNPGVGGDSGAQVTGVAVQSDGKILVAGHFTTLGGQARTNIGRLKADGTLDDDFNPGAMGLSGGGVALQMDGKLLVSGTFTNLAGQACTNFGRLNVNGTLDDGFNPGTNGNFLALQPDGRILIVGSFTNTFGQTRRHITRLHTNGAVDVTFAAEADFYVTSAALQADGKVVIVGAFTNLAGQLRTCVGRLNTNGTLDTAFSISVTGSSPVFGPVVNAVALQPDGRILLAGSFITLGGQSRGNIGRLINTDAATQNLVLSGSNVTWLHGGTSPEFWRMNFDVTTNGVDWTALGDGDHIAEGWQFTGVPAADNVVVRARGFVAGTLCANAFIERTSTPIVVRNDAAFGFRTNQFGFTVAAGAGQTVVVDGSTNLSNWISCSTNRIESGWSLFRDPQSQIFPRRFYRARFQ